MAGSRLGIYLDEDGNEQQQPYPIEDGPWDFDEDDMLLIALLQDPIYCAELLCEDPNNREYAGMYRVRDYQYPLNRGAGSNYEGYTCARSVGKSESIKNRTMTHPFRRVRENLLITAPELIHLLPLTDAIEDRINSCRLTREFLDVDAGRTGFTHRPFGVDFVDGTKIVGRIPRLTGPQPLDARILTPRGWITMGTLKPGDHVTGSDGRPTKVVRVVENEVPQPVYRVEFTDGATTEASGDHEWLVADPCASPKEWHYLTTGEIRETLDRQRGPGSRRRMWQIPRSHPVEFEQQESLPLDPYVLGVLLGDGGFSTHSVFLTSGDDEVVREVDRLLPDGAWVVADPKRSYRYRIRGRGGRVRNPVITALRDVGLLGTNCESKFIPASYMRASVSERLALLQGIVDTDGTVTKAGKVEVTGKNEHLIRQVAELVRSLGGWASVRSQEHKPYTQTINGAEYQNLGGLFWRVALVLDDAARLTRKRERLRTRVQPRVRSIRSVEYVGEKLVRCFRLDNDDHLYITDDYVLTAQTGVKGQHQPDLLVDEAQDYPDRGWTEVHETVLKDHEGFDGEPDFSYVFYGVHSGARDSGFHKRATQGGFKITQITALMRPGWGTSEKNAAKAAYGGTSSPDYRRNIYGEPGSASSPLFNAARLMACMDQDRESDYNLHGYRFQEIRAEEFDELGLPIAEVLDLPSGLKRVWVGADLGLTVSPTVIMIFSEERIAGKMRLKLVRRIHLERMRTKQIRHAFYAIATHFGDAFMGLGMDETGLGFPIWQEIEDDELAPAILLQRSRGWFFNSKVPVGIAPEHVARDERGSLSDQYYGGAVTEQIDPMTGERKYIVTMPMIEASTRYLRDWVDKTYFMFPFDPAVIGDMQGDTQQRLKRIVGLKNKPNAFHILDAERVMAMIFKAGEIEEQLATSDVAPVLELAIDDYADVY